MTQALRNLYDLVLVNIRGLETLGAQKSSFSSTLCDILLLCALPRDIVVPYHRSCAMQAARYTGSNVISSRLDGLLTFISIKLESLEKNDNRGRELGTTLSPKSVHPHNLHNGGKRLKPKCSSKHLKPKCVGSTRLALNTSAIVSDQAAERPRIVQVQLRSHFSDEEILAIRIPHICQAIEQTAIEVAFIASFKKLGKDVADELVYPSIVTRSVISIPIGSD
ncbi:hypothetical protein HPB50_013698 [Hyalomma asiaticum]|uniref:Uncharacterized protein n=1 Tax=Hyalomma asiaticum TaxID=266040 RepID=A0ACB7RR79_HYAAI|nr:hypothetical protein HPB50_013698 [Hyalomma asiaticum]